MTGRPLISVITACYNAADFIEQCLTSVMEQDFPDVEYIVIDGGSTDDTPAIIGRHAHTLAYWHSRPDRGIAHAFNLGIEKSRGEWLMFLNADDYLHDRAALSTFAATIHNYPRVDVIHGMILFVTRESKPKRVGKPYGEAFDWKRFTTMHSIPHPACLTSRRFIERVGLFDESYRIAMDYELFLRGGRQLCTVFLPRVTTCMRLGGASRLDWYTSLNEWFAATVSHRALSRGRACLLYVYFYAKSVLGGLVRERVR